MRPLNGLNPKTLNPKPYNPNVTSMTGAALGRTAGHDVAELLSSAELKRVRAGEGEDALEVNVVVINH